MFVDRNADGHIVALYSNPQRQDHEFVDGAQLWTPEPTPLQAIEQIEAAKPITHRNLRDLTLAVADIASAITGKPVDENPAVREIQTMEAQIAALRAQAKEQGLI